MYYLNYFLEGIFPYLAILIFLVGTGYQMWRWLRIPVPLRVNLAPSKTTWRAVTGKISSEVLVFSSLFKSNRTFWVVVWIMHVCGLAILLGSHFFGVIAESLGMFANITLPLGRTIPYIAAVFSFPLLATLLIILFRRIVIKEVKRLSLLPDYFALILILVHVIDGVYMTYFTNFDVIEGMKWGVGLVTFHPYVVPDSWIFAAHCLTGFGLFLYFPFSKLFHPLGQITNQWTMTQKEVPLVEKGAVVK